MCRPACPCRWQVLLCRACRGAAPGSRSTSRDPGAAPRACAVALAVARRLCDGPGPRGCCLARRTPPQPRRARAPPPPPLCVCPACPLPKHMYHKTGALIESLACPIPPWHDAALNAPNSSHRATPFRRRQAAHSRRAPLSTRVQSRWAKSHPLPTCTPPHTHTHGRSRTILLHNPPHPPTLPPPIHRSQATAASAWICRSPRAAPWRRSSPRSWASCSRCAPPRGWRVGRGFRGQGGPLVILPALRCPRRAACAAPACCADPLAPPPLSTHAHPGRPRGRGHGDLHLQPGGRALRRHRQGASCETFARLAVRRVLQAQPCTAPRHTHALLENSLAPPTTHPSPAPQVTPDRKCEIRVGGNAVVSGSTPALRDVWEETSFALERLQVGVGAALGGGWRRCATCGRRPALRSSASRCVAPRAPLAL